MSGIEPVKGDTIAAIHGLDVGHQRERTHLGAFFLRGGNIVTVQRIPCINLAADVAVTQMYAGPLFHPLRIDERFALRDIVRIVLVVAPVRIERDGKLQFFKAVTMSNLVGAVFHQLHARRPLVVGDLLHIHELGYRVIVWLENFFRPAVVENCFRRLAGNVGVDE